jgi:hypothetical protein
VIPGIEKAAEYPKDECKQSDDPLTEVVVELELLGYNHFLGLGRAGSDCNEDTHIQQGKTFTFVGLNSLE